MREKLEFKILSIGITINVIAIIFSVLIVLYIQKSALLGSAEEKIGSVTDIITRSIERGMINNSVDFVRDMLNDIQSVQGVEKLEVFNNEGREAFNPDAYPEEAQALIRLAENPVPFSFYDKKTLIVYKPLLNKAACQVCHGAEKKLRGAVKVTVSLKKEYAKLKTFAMIIIIGGILGTVMMVITFWMVLRKFVISPIIKLKEEAGMMADGDLTFKTGIVTKDEIGDLNYSIKSSLYSMSGILTRVKDITGRISGFAESVESDSDRIVDGTNVTAESVANISSSVEQLNAAITEISESTEGLASSVEETAASIEEMTSSIESVSETTQGLAGGIESTSSSIEELSATLKEVASNAGELAEVSEETLSAIEEIISSIKEIELSAKESAKLSERTTSDASTLGVQSINKTIEGMNRIKTTVEATATSIKKLGGRSIEIGKILDVINEITDQTTLLALNAAILAAKAGESGRGFSVVADEIKDLAERTAFSTQEIGSLIQAVQTEVKDAMKLMSNGVKSVDEGITLSSEAGESFKKILESSKMSSEMALSIEGSTAEQSKAARFVSESVERVRSMVGQIAKSTSEQFKGISLIMKSTERMRDASTQVTRATKEQVQSSKQISQAVEMVSEKTHQISNALNEQKSGSRQIFAALEKIKDIPKENRDIAFKVSKSVTDLKKDAEFLMTEVERFKLYEDKDISVLGFGIMPIDAQAVMFKRFTPLAEYLGSRLGKKVEIKVPIDFKTAIQDLGSGKIQLCYMTPSTYIEAHRNFGATLLVSALRNGKAYHHSAIVTKQDSSILSIADIKKRSFAFVDKESTSSYIVPLSMLKNEGIELADLSQYSFLGRHHSVAEAVLKGDFDAGGIMESMVEKYKDKGLKIIALSEEIPEFNICVNLDEESDVQTLRSAFLALNTSNAEGASILGAIDKSYTGFAEANDADYNDIRLIISKMEAT